jgi:transposase
MAFLRIEKKPSGTYLRIVHSYKVDGVAKHKTLYSLGRVEDYHPEQLIRIGKKLIELGGVQLEDIVASSFKEINRVNYGYALVIKRLWNIFNMNDLVMRIKRRHKVKFDWMEVLQLMIAERLNEPGSKRKNWLDQGEYIGFKESYDLQYFYRTLDILNQEQEAIKQHLYAQQRNLFSQTLDVIFYDVTTLYFDSQIEEEGNLRQKGYSKDGKCHNTQIVLGLLVDKLRNPITYHIYEGNTYEGKTLIDALNEIKKHYQINRVIIVADSAMIDKDNRAYMIDHQIDYILGDRIKSLPETIKQQLLDRSKHIVLSGTKETEEGLSYTTIEYKGRRIICTYSSQRAKKDAYEREKLLEKAKMWLSNPSQYNQVKKRGAGRYICSDDKGAPRKLDEEKIKQDEVYDGFKAIATTTDLPIEDVLSKYRDLYEVEHAFRTLKSELEIRPIFHWTNKRIEGHIAMCFIAYTFLNYLRNTSKLQIRQVIKALDEMQLSVVKEDKSEELVYMRSSIKENQKILIDKLKLEVPRDVTPQYSINQYFK